MKKKILTLLLIICCSIHTSIYANSNKNVVTIHKNANENTIKPGSVMFAPPKGWRLADNETLSKNIEVMVIGQGQNDFPPSINIATEAFPGSLKEYLKIVKQINDSQGSYWKDLGTIRTKAGNGSLSQVDSKSEWGDVRMMHVILKKDDKVIILTSAALKEEFPKFYKDFFTSMRSLDIAK